jgi:stress response protein YsnF
MAGQPEETQRQPDIHDADDVVLNRVEEQVELTKQRVVDSHVSVTRSTIEQQEVVSTLLNKDRVEVKHVPKMQYVDEMPAIREEEGVMIVPVVEEEIHIIRKLVLKEELHIYKVQETVPFEEVVTLRKQQVQVEKTKAKENDR